jgi:hypothetical protein
VGQAPQSEAQKTMVEWVAQTGGASGGYFPKK